MTYLFTGPLEHEFLLFCTSLACKFGFQFGQLAELQIKSKLGKSGIVSSRFLLNTLTVTLWLTSRNVHLSSSFFPVRTRYITRSMLFSGLCKCLASGINREGCVVSAVVTSGSSELLETQTSVSVEQPGSGPMRYEWVIICKCICSYHPARLIATKMNFKYNVSGRGSFLFLPLSFFSFLPSLPIYIRVHDPK